MSELMERIEPWTGDETERFELLGARVCLDFTNTVTWTAEGPVRDRLAEFGHLVGWGEAAGVLDAPQAAAMRARADAEPAAADAALAEARLLRAALHGVFGAHARGAVPAPADLAAFNAALL